MTRIALFAGGRLDDFSLDFDVLVGVDRGSLFLLEQGVCPDLAVGDFDSVSEQELLRIKAAAKEVIQAQPEKNDTDLELAVLACFERYPDASLTIFGAFGGRLDHALANVFLPSNEKIAPYMQQLSLLDAQNRLTYVPQGRHEIKPTAGMRYLAFLPAEDTVLTIEGAKYPLNEQNFFFKKVYASNEFIDEPLFLEVASGYAVVIYSRDRS
ncbi:thiamine diphosphokinase [Streptococcus panodentis]|uniref:Thiamine diphosphokinase n=1 Tax=Streptococcus panodentis TaxID=1581472 RepID=A0ABS5AVS7_9STRE|nr:thiamine diphosphokinase [Streptococcus panodentis]MBP2620665.1 thiamine diphosphokinase [Streptococcus panodentis]